MTSAAYAAERFRQTYKGSTNFLSPYVIRYGTAGPYFYELSKGAGGPWQLFGVTVITLAGEKRHDLSQAFSTVDEAEGYIRTLRQTD